MDKQIMGKTYLSIQAADPVSHPRDQHQFYSASHPMPNLGQQRQSQNDHPRNRSQTRLHT